MIAYTVSVDKSPRCGFVLRSEERQSGRVIAQMHYMDYSMKDARREFTQYTREQAVLPLHKRNYFK